MRFNVNKLGQVDENAKNIFRVIPPYYYLLNKDSKNNESEKKKVIFFGCCFKNLPRDVNFHEYVKITNQCLDFVRRECVECELYYKPHPAETDESKLLNLNSFKIETSCSSSSIFPEATTPCGIFSFPKRPSRRPRGVVSSSPYLID